MCVFVLVRWVIVFLNVVMGFLWVLLKGMLFSIRRFRWCGLGLFRLMFGWLLSRVKILV